MPELATRVFQFDDAPVKSPIADRIWRSRSVPVESFTSVVAAHWESS